MKSAKLIMQIEDDDFINECECSNPPSNFADFEEISIGTTANYAEISIKICRKCRIKWLHYFYENEAFSKSGRWYRGLISEQEIAKLLPEKAVSHLENLKWYIYGGSYFETTGKYGSGKIRES
jgi:hypothetical protein